MSGFGRRRDRQRSLPTSASRGSRSTRPPFPVMHNSPARQSMSSSARPATSPARSPSRARRLKMAAYLRPIAMEVSQLPANLAAASDVTVDGSTVRGHVAMPGTASTSERLDKAFDVEEAQQCTKGGDHASERRRALLVPRRADQ